MSTEGPDRWFFDVWSLGYDLELPQRLAYRPVHDAVLHTLAADVPRRVLDVGCGTGELAKRIRQTFPKTTVVGCDFSAGMLQRAAAKGAARHWVQGDACRLPFRNGSFDAVTSTEAFHWFPDQDRALREFHRVLAPGGRLLLALASPPLPVMGSLAEVGARLIGQPFHWPTRVEIRQRLASAGFRVEDQSRVFRFPGLLLMPLLTSAIRPSAPRQHRERAERQGQVASVPKAASAVARIGAAIPIPPKRPDAEVMVEKR
jgi:SAM-dependent methyltransferase